MYDNEKQVWKSALSMIINCKKNLFSIFICLIFLSVTSFLQPIMLKEITDKGIGGEDSIVLVVWVILLSVIKLSESGINIIKTSNFIKIHNYLFKSLNEKMFNKLYRLPITFFKEKNSAEIINTLKTDINNISSISNEIAALSATAILQIITGIVGLILISWEMAFVIIALIPIKCVIVNKFSNGKERILKFSLEGENNYSAWLGEQIDGIREMKLWNLFRKKYFKLKQFQDELALSYEKNMMWDRYYSFCEEMLDAVVYSVLFLLGGLLVINKKITMGGLLAFISYFSYIMVPISLLINGRYYFAKIRPSLIRFYDFLKLPDEEYIAENDVEIRDLEMEPLIEFCHVAFSYNDRNILLKDISFKIYNKEKIALIGSNGSGKSTIFDLMLGLYQPQAGEIKIGGNLINDMGMESVRKRIAIVNQRLYFYDTSIEDNINIEGKASTSEIEKVSIKSGVEKFVKDLPQDYRQNLGKNGEKLSGGERQKIAVARALLKEAEIILLDEATNGYDIESKNISLFDIFQEQTVIMITHKYEELKKADRIYRIVNGELLEENLNSISDDTVVREGGGNDEEER